jgi:CRISPR system Cascade subunit CasC
MFVELHMIQSFAPSNLNRDDTNNPKDCEFGGARRARISSQCLKRAIRLAPEFQRATEVTGGTRTRRVIEYLAPRLAEAGKPQEEVTAVLGRFVPGFWSKLDKDGQRTSVLLYLSDSELAAIQEALLEEWEPLVLGDDKVLTRVVRDLTKTFRQHTSAPDIALFGRMLAERPELNLEAACQVAHAISTHRVTMEMDWWTAVDDLQPEDNAGAGMMGFSSFDSACFYRYARIDWDGLCETLGDAPLARRTVSGFLQAAIAAVPSGKQNSHAAYNPPSFLLGVVRRDGMAWSLANAFEQPVSPDRQGGLVRPSVAALDHYWGRLCGVYGGNTLAAVAALGLDDDLPLEALTPHLEATQAAWLARLLAALEEERTA